MFSLFLFSLFFLLFTFFRKYCDFFFIKNFAEKVYTGVQPETCLMSLKAKLQRKRRQTSKFYIKNRRYLGWFQDHMTRIYLL